MTSRYYFVMVGREDNPLYQRGFSCKEANDSENKYYYEFIAHASLDLLDEQMWQTEHMFLKTIDKFNDMLVSAFVTPTGIKFLMVHDGKNEEGIKKFFTSVYEIFVKYSMNPFYRINTPINSTYFDSKVNFFGRKFLTPN